MGRTRDPVFAARNHHLLGRYLMGFRQDGMHCNFSTSGAAPKTFTLLSHAVGSTSSPPVLDTRGALVVIIATADSGPPVPEDSLGNTFTLITFNSGAFSGCSLYKINSPIITSAAHEIFVAPGGNTGIAVAAFGGTSINNNVVASNNNYATGITAFQPGSITPVTKDLVVASICLHDNVALDGIDSGMVVTDYEPLNGGVNWGVGLAWGIGAGAPLDPTWTVSAAAGIAGCIGELS